MAQTQSSALTTSTSAQIGLVLGMVFFLLVLWLPAPPDMPKAAWHCLGLTLLMATWWSTQALPIPVTSLLPLVLAPALGLEPINAIASNYGHPIIFLFLGGFMLGLAMQRWALHRRLALHILLIVGHQPRRQIAGLMLATGFLSMWVSNTATTIMMLPIALSFLSLFEQDDPKNLERYATAMLLAIAYAASIGGIATLIGTAPNALVAGYLYQHHDIEVGFAHWMAVGLPVAVLLMLLSWWWMTRKEFGLKAPDNAHVMIQQQLTRLGRIRSAEIRVGLVFLLTALLWVTRPALNHLGLAWLSDAGIAIIAAILLFVLPSGHRRGERLMDWQETQALPWGILLLFGGGLALAGLITETGLAQWIASHLGYLDTLPVLLMIGVVVLVVIFLTEVTSNTAIAAAFLPLLGALAVSFGVDPILITIPAAIAASCAFMMPVATPPNAIVFASGHLSIQSMIRKGFMLNLIGVLVVTLLGYGLLVLFW